MSKLKDGFRYQTPHEALKAHWGFDDFRGIQSEIIQNVLANRDTLGLMPTGGGKSVCYQVPALVLPGVTLVVSPLLALMKDQVDSLQRKGIRAAALYSGMTLRQRENIYNRARFGGLELLYLSPERLSNPDAQTQLSTIPINLIAVDEAHCISQWGHDFRPAYRQISEIRSLFPQTKILALTATATPLVVDDIRTSLAFDKHAKTFSMSFERKNLVYAVRYVDDKVSKLIQVLSRVQGAAVAYVNSRNRTIRIAKYLNQRGIKAVFYHGGMTMKERTKTQNEWIEGKARVVVATNAFGMGIDKSDVRIVVHLDLPNTLEGYFQEAGRAGRDGQKSFGLLLYHPQDAQKLRFNLEASYPSVEKLKTVYEFISQYCHLAIGTGKDQSFDFDLLAFAEYCKLPPVEVHHAVNTLVKHNLFYLTDHAFTPSSLSFICSRETLYHYQEKNLKFKELLTLLLRTHPGAFEENVVIKEHKLTAALNQPIEEIKQNLKALNDLDVIDYIPRSETPKLIWIENRMSSKHLVIDWKQQRERKQHDEKKINAAISYALSKICRSNQLLSYFGQEAENCGQCDICLKNKQQVKELLHVFIPKVKSILKREQLTLNEMIDSFNSRHKDHIVYTINHLLEEGVINKDGQIYQLKDE